jgi:lipoprotein-releasing system ATP-binding protein
MIDKKPIITTQDLNKFYYEPVTFQVLKEINLTMYEGEFISIVGASGSGKSTLLYTLSTLDGDYKGNIWFEDTDIRNLNNNDLANLRNTKIGFVFQFHYLLPEFTVLENVMMPAMRQKDMTIEEMEHKAYEKLKLFGMHEQADKKASKLSGGQQQRVAIARALMNDPKILFGDEPTGNLDSKNAEMVFELFETLQKEFKQTILLVTHDDKFAHRTQRSITLRDGEVLSDIYK